MFQPIQRYLKLVSNTNNHILSENSKGLSASTYDNKVNILLHYVGSKIRVEFTGSCLKLDGISFNHDKIVNI